MGRISELGVADREVKAGQESRINPVFGLSKGEPGWGGACC